MLGCLLYDLAGAGGANFFSIEWQIRETPGGSIASEQ
jgi:hypothetical protein